MPCSALQILNTAFFLVGYLGFLSTWIMDTIYTFVHKCVFSLPQLKGPPTFLYGIDIAQYRRCIHAVQHPDDVAYDQILCLAQPAARLVEQPCEDPVERALAALRHGPWHV